MRNPMLIPIKLTEAQVLAAMRGMRLTDSPENRQRAVDHLVRQMLAPKPFKQRAVLQVAGPTGKVRWR